MARRSEASRARIGLFAAGLVLIGTTGAACSLVNSFGDVKEGTTSSGSTSGTGATSTATGSGGSGGEGGGGGAAVSSSHSSSQSGSATGSGGMEAGAPVTPLLVGGTDLTPGLRAITVLDANTGVEVTGSRLDDIHAIAMVYDPATKVYYVFSADNFPPNPAQPMSIYAGQVSDDGKWKELGHITSNVPVLRNFHNVAVLNNRLVYLAYQLGAVDDSMPLGIAIFDTSKVLDSGGFQLAGSNGKLIVPPVAPNGIMGTPSGQTGQSGGSVDLVEVTNCSSAAGTCDYNLRIITVPSDTTTTATVASTATFVTKIPIAGGAVQGTTAAWAAARFPTPSDVVAYPTGTATGSAALQTALPATGAADANYPMAGVNASQIFGMTLAPCDNAAIFTDSTGFIYAAPLQTGLATSHVSSGDPRGAFPYYDAGLKRAFIPFVNGLNSTLRAYDLTKDASGPELHQVVSNWSPPTDFATDLVAPREAISCP